MKIFILASLILMLSACSESHQPHTATEDYTDEQQLSSSATLELYREANTLYEQGDILGAQSKLEIASNHGDLHAKELLGFILLKEPEVSDLKTGFSLVSEAATGGLASAQFYLGSCLYDDGCGIPENKILSAYWLKKALANGESGAKMLLSFLEEESINTEIDEKQYDNNYSDYLLKLK